MHFIISLPFSLSLLLPRGKEIFLTTTYTVCVVCTVQSPFSESVSPLFHYHHHFVPLSSVSFHFAVRCQFACQFPHSVPAPPPPTCNCNLTRVTLNKSLFAIAPWPGVVRIKSVVSCHVINKGVLRKVLTYYTYT
jgi:hypothetical protein